MNESILLSAIIGMPVENNPPQDPISINIVIPKKEHKEKPKLEIIELEKPKELEIKKPILTIPIEEEKEEEEISKKQNIDKVIIDSRKCDSILNNNDSGFGPELTITIPKCPKPKHFIHLYKENYLGEFKEESEKVLARYNLGVYSKTEIDDILSKIVEKNKNYVTKSLVEGMLKELDFVDSILKSYADYQIPNNLFKL